MKKNKIMLVVKIIVLIMYIICAIVLIAEAATKGPESASQSTSVGTIIADVVNEVAVTVKGTPAITNMDSFLAFIRKAVGHFGAFLIFGIFSTFTYILWFNRKYRIYSLLINIFQGVFLASLTEFIQSFTPGRCGAMKDVVIDSGGFITSALVITIIYCIYEIIRYRRVNKNENRNE